jgi:hypothetical protein
MFSLAAGRAAEPGRPNVIVILADDLGHADLGLQGGQDFPTPHLNAPARGDVRCTNGHVSCPVCSPTRAGLLTGWCPRPDDLPKAARDWPRLNLSTDHACIQPNFFLADTLEEVNAGKLRGGVPDIRWTTEYAQFVQDLLNCYAELGTTWASSVVTFPTIAAHILGQFLKFMGEDRIVFGSDSVWYGSRQWQVEAVWRFQIPGELRQKYGYPELTERAKRKILGRTSARLYGIKAVDPGAYRAVPKDYESRMDEELKTVLEFGRLKEADNLSRMRETYAALAIEPDHTRYGWIRVRA